MQVLDMVIIATEVMAIGAISTPCCLTLLRLLQPLWSRSTPAVPNLGTPEFESEVLPIDMVVDMEQISQPLPAAATIQPPTATISQPQAELESVLDSSENSYDCTLEVGMVAVLSESALDECFELPF